MTRRQLYAKALRVRAHPGATVPLLNSGTLQLGFVRDSVLYVANDYALFAETFENAARAAVNGPVYVAVDPV